MLWLCSLYIALQGLVHHNTNTACQHQKPKSINTCLRCLFACLRTPSGSCGELSICLWNWCCVHFRPPAKLLPHLLKSLYDCLILTPPLILTQPSPTPNPKPTNTREVIHLAGDRIRAQHWKLKKTWLCACRTHVPLHSPVATLLGNEWFTIYWRWVLAADHGRVAPLSSRKYVTYTQCCQVRGFPSELGYFSCSNQLPQVVFHVHRLKRTQ